MFIDMDGTIAVFHPVDSLEILYEKGYFADLKPIRNVVQAAKLIIQEHPEIEVNILSAYLTDSKYALEEKNLWLDKYLPEIKPENRIFTPCGSDKKDFIPGGVTKSDYLLDDYTNNLNTWQPPASGIKLLNGINHSRGTWENDRIRFDKPPSVLANNIAGIMLRSERVMDAKPDLCLHHVSFNSRIDVQELGPEQ